MRASDEVRVLAVGGQGLTAPGFRVRVLLLRPELARYRARVEPYALFTPGEATAFSDGGLRQRARVLLSARRRLASQLAKAKGGAYDVTLIQRQVDLLPGLGLERRATAERPLVWDVDDAIWLDTSSQAHGHRLAALKGTRRKVNWLASHADRIIAANPILADFLSRLSSRVTIVPSVVETRMVQPRMHEDGPEVIFGWIGSYTTAPYLSALAGVLTRVSQELPGRALRLLVVGGTLPASNRYAVESVPWSVEYEREALGRIDVGLMPMPDNAWTRGKSAYKALQYMSAGIPVVGDDVGVSAEVIRPGSAGFVVRGEDEWVEALVALGKDAELRARLGKRGRTRAEEDFSVTRWAPVVANILRGES